jgi:quinol monooxygenase YgiN
MSKELVAIAVFEPQDGKDAECLATVRELTGFLRSMGYSHDTLYRDRRNPRLYVDVRLWSSEEAARQAHQDPRLHAFWQRLEDLCTIKQVYEALEEVR